MIHNSEATEVRNIFGPAPWSTMARFTITSSTALVVAFTDTSMAKTFGNSTSVAVNDSIPDVPLPRPDLTDIALHPDLLTELPRSTAVVGFTDTATVREARDAFRKRTLAVR